MTTSTFDGVSGYNMTVAHATAVDTRPASTAGARVRQRVVLCGSMTAMSLMIALKDELAEAGLDVVLPEIDQLSPQASSEQMRERKRSASLAHMALIKEPDTAAILVANIDKNGRCDYVGPNAFAEIAVAVAESRMVFLWGGLPEDLREELDAWKVRTLNGDLRRLVTCLHGHKPRTRPTAGPVPISDGQGDLYS